MKKLFILANVFIAFTTAFLIEGHHPSTQRHFDFSLYPTCRRGPFSCEEYQSKMFIFSLAFGTGAISCGIIYVVRDFKARQIIRKHNQELEEKIRRL